MPRARPDEGAAQQVCCCCQSTIALKPLSIVQALTCPAPSSTEAATFLRIEPLWTGADQRAQVIVFSEQTIRLALCIQLGCRAPGGSVLLGLQQMFAAGRQSYPNAA